MQDFQQVGNTGNTYTTLGHNIVMLGSFLQFFCRFK